MQRRHLYLVKAKIKKAHKGNIFEVWQDEFEVKAVDDMEARARAEEVLHLKYYRRVNTVFEIVGCRKKTTSAKKNS